MNKYQAVIPLGGGRNKNGSLTEMSCERLDKAVAVFESGIADLIFSLGGHKSTYRPNAIEFSQPGGVLRAKYLSTKGVPMEKIIILKMECRDTIGEALAVREYLQSSEIKKLLVVTSELHLPRALFLFRRILGTGFEIYAESVPSNGLLIGDEEKEYLELAKRFFLVKPAYIREKSFDEWFLGNQDYYFNLLSIHDKYHSLGKESQAYFAVKE